MVILDSSLILLLKSCDPACLGASQMNSILLFLLGALAFQRVTASGREVCNRLKPGVCARKREEALYRKLRVSPHLSQSRVHCAVAALGVLCQLTMQIP